MRSGAACILAVALLAALAGPAAFGGPLQDRGKMGSDPSLKSHNMPGVSSASAPARAADAAPKKVLLDGSSKDPMAVERAEHTQAADWVRTLEFTVKNVSGKPVYLAEYSISLPEVRGPKGPLTVALVYGNAELKATHRSGPKDKSLQPNKTVKLKLTPEAYRSLEEQLAQAKAAAPTRVILRLRTVSFGDGTGWQDGYPVQR